MDSEVMNRVHTALDAIRAGRMVILVDDEDRENEGDLVMAAEHVRPDDINFMARFGRGIICLSLTDKKVRALDLPMMVEDNRSSRTTAFTVSIEAREGVSTGISAADRAHTVQTAVRSDNPRDLVSPGHVFPLRSQPGGVLQRSGHTEGSIDLARMAGCQESAVICEIMNDDGTMARHGDLVQFSKEHQLPVISIADIIQYRLQHERIVHRVKNGPVVLGNGNTWNAQVYETSVDQRQFLALMFGDYAAPPTLVRVQTASPLGDIFGVRAGTRVLASEAVRRIEQEGAGVLLFVPGRGDLAADLAFHLGDKTTRLPTDQGEVLREYGLGAQVLADLGLRQIRILTNRPRRIASFSGYGLEVVEQIVLQDVEAHKERTTH
ncbi:MAG: 3,4-dihydroxy-2-butanone-4-phosphate synthase [Myxococcota bacterium]